MGSPYFTSPPTDKKTQRRITCLSLHPDCPSVGEVWGSHSGMLLLFTVWHNSINANNILISSVYLTSPNSTQLINENWNEVVPKALMLDYTASNPESIAEAAREFYFGEKNVSRETQANLTNMFSGK